MESEFAEFQAILDDEPSPRLGEPTCINSASLPLRAITLYLTQACNMSCIYCWNDRGHLGERARRMSPGTASAVADWICASLPKEASSAFSVKMYGGEPLLNFPAIKTIVDRVQARADDIRIPVAFTLDTNGYHLEGDTTTFIAEHFSEVAISIDGRPRIHESQRPLAHGGASWERIARNIRRFPQPERLGLRATLTKNSDTYLETYNFLRRFDVSSIQIEYCQKPLTASPEGFRELEVTLLRQRAEMIEFVDWYVDQLAAAGSATGLPLPASLLWSISSAASAQRHSAPCGAGAVELAVDAQGKIFPCLAFVGQRPFELGNVGPAVERPIRAVAGSTGRRCATCWARDICGGGCAADNYYDTGCPAEPSLSSCESALMRAEVALHALARLKALCPWFEL